MWTETACALLALISSGFLFRWISKHKERVSAMVVLTTALAGAIYPLYQLSLFVIGRWFKYEEGWQVWWLSSLATVYLWYLSIILSILTFVLLVWGITSVKKRQILFRRLFGENPPTEEKDHQLMQSAVDRKLEWMAFWLQTLYDAETKLLSESTSDREIAELKREELKEMQICVSRAKKVFWRAHGIAGAFDFRTHSSFREYADSYKLRIEAQALPTKNRRRK